MKLIASFCMLLDHIGMMFFPLDIEWRLIGRLAMPIFAYGVARGAFYTRSLERYMKKMLLFSFMSQIPFWGMMYYSQNSTVFSLHLNVGFTFLLALVAIRCLKEADIIKVMSHEELQAAESEGTQEEHVLNRNQQQKTIRTKWVIGALGSIILADLLNTDYGSYGVLMVLMGYFFFLKGQKILLLAGSYVVLTFMFFGVGGSGIGFFLQGIGVLAYGIIALTKQWSEKRWSRFFYWFYPVHMTVLVLIRMIERSS